VPETRARKSKRKSIDTKRRKLKGHELQEMPYSFIIPAPRDQRVSLTCNSLETI
jgi:hypothetical protein